MVDDLPVPVIVLDEKRNIKEINSAALKLLDARREDLIGRSCAQALRPRRMSGEDLLAEDWHRSAYLRTARRINEEEVRILRPDGHEIAVLVDGAYVRDDSGELQGATLLLRSRHKGLRRPRSGVRIVSAVSHELRSPLTSIRGYTTLLLKRWDIVTDDERREMLMQVDRDARRISRMIGELLDVSRIETGRVVLNRIEIDLPKLTSEVLEKVAMTYPDVEAQLRFQDDFPPIWADPGKVEQVLTNLLENACKYASPSGIVITAKLEENEAVIEVHDRGPGIPAADLPRLFQQFFRSREGRPTGTGLGLWISRGLIEAHGGTLTAESDGENGSTFRFTLPQRHAERLDPSSLLG